MLGNIALNLSVDAGLSLVNDVGLFKRRIRNIAEISRICDSHSGLAGRKSLRVKTVALRSKSGRSDKVCKSDLI